LLFIFKRKKSHLNSFLIEIKHGICLTGAS
jgi:hypothetical protein